MSFVDRRHDAIRRRITIQGEDQRTESFWLASPGDGPATADTLSIATMEAVDNLVMLVIPGAMDAGLVDPLFWISMPVALTAAFFAALPVNQYLLNRNKGHALTMQYHPAHGEGHACH